MENTVAMENVFDPELTAQKMLDQFKEKVTSSVTTIDAAATLENELSEETARFNDCLLAIQNARNKVLHGEVSKEDGIAEMTPYIQTLKDRCTAFKMNDVKISGTDISENEIAMLRQFIMGCKDIVAKRKEELQGGAKDGEPGTESTTEPTTEGAGLLEEINNMEPATEARGGWQNAKTIEKSREVKEAVERYKTAKKMFKDKNYTAAKKHVTTAIKLFEGQIAKIKKEGDIEKNAAGRQISGKASRSFSLDTSSSIGNFSVGVSKGNNKYTQVLYWLMDRLDACKALLYKIEHPNEKKEIKALKVQMKQERKALHQQNKMSVAPESFIDADEMEMLDAGTIRKVQAYESMIDALETEAVCEAAMEATGDEGAAPSDAGTRYKNAMKEMKKAKKAGDTAAVAKWQKEAEDAAKDIEAEANSSDPQKKKHGVRNAMIALGSIAAVTAITGAGMYAAGKKLNARDAKIQERIDKLNDRTGSDPAITANRVYNLEQKQTNSKAGNFLKRFSSGADKVAGDVMSFIKGSPKDIAKAGKPEKQSEPTKAEPAKAQESLLASLIDDGNSEATEGCGGKACETDECEDGVCEPEGRAFDDDDMIEDAEEAMDDLDELEPEEAVAREAFCDTMDFQFGVDDEL